MNTQSTHNFIYYVFVPLALCGLCFPVWTLADTTNSDSSSVYSYSQTRTFGDGTAQVEVSQTTIINGETHVYEFATTSSGPVEQYVEIENGEIISVSSNKGTKTTSVRNPNPDFKPNSDVELFSISDPTTEPNNTSEVIVPIQPTAEIFATPEQIEAAEDIRWLLKLINYLYYLYAE